MHDNLRHCHRGNETVIGTYGTVDQPPYKVPFYGGYRTRVYDPRYRAWYKVTRNQMRATTSNVYTMFTSQQLGFTLTLPIFDYCTNVPGVGQPANTFFTPIPPAGWKPTRSQACKPYNEIVAGEVKVTAKPVVGKSAQPKAGEVKNLGAGVLMSSGDGHGFKTGTRIKATSQSRGATYHTVIELGLCETTVDAATGKFKCDAPDTHAKVGPAIPDDTTEIIEDRAKRLAGVMGADYILVAFNQWLIDNYGQGTGEDARYVYIEEPDNNLIASSLEVPLYVSEAEVADGTKSSKDERRKTTDAYLENVPGANPTDKYLPMFISAKNLAAESYASCKTGKLNRVSLPKRDDNGETKKRSDGTDIEEPFYIQCLEYARPGIDWRVVIISRGEKSFDDFISFSQPETAGMAGIIVVIAALGSFILLVFLVHLIMNRHKPYYRVGDWRFLALFETGAMLCCLSVFTYLGPDSKDELGSQVHASLCLVRIWLFNVLFTFTFSALFWKVHRMWRFLDNPKMKRIIIKDSELALKLTALVLVDVVILGIWTGVAPPTPRSNPGVVGVPTDFVDHIVCSSDTVAFAVIEIVWKAILVVGGCFLAVKTRKQEAKYAESKGLMAAMYNVAFIGVIILLLVFLLDGVGENGKTLLKAIGVFWGSVFSVAVIVVPRILGAHHKYSSTSGTQGTSATSATSHVDVVPTPDE